MEPQPIVPKPVGQTDRPWNIFALLAALFFTAFISFIWINGTSLTYSGDLLKGGDLEQHYVAGLMWNEGRSDELYRDFRFSNRVVEWENSISLREQSKTLPNSFNYVYSPLVAQIASYFTRWSFSTWIWISLALMAASAILGWLLLSRLEIGLYLRRYEDWVLLFSYPCLWYTIIPHQNSIVSLFLVSQASLFLARGFPFLAGMTLACVFYKPHFVLSLGLIILAAGRFRMFLGIASATTMILVAQLFAGGWDLNWGWVQSMSMSVSGRQFQQIGLNQSLRGWVLSVPYFSGPTGAWITFTMSISLCILVGLWLKNLERKGVLKPGHLLLLAAAIWTVVSPYTPFYDFLMLIGLWAISCRALPETSSNLIVCFMGWLVSLLCASGEMGVAWLTAPLVTLWLFLAIRSLASANSPLFHRT